MTKLLITVAIIIEIGALMAVRGAEAKKPSLNVFFNIAESVSEKELFAMSNRDIEKLANILNK